VYDRWTTPDLDPRTYGTPVGELATYREYLSNYRLTIRMKCDDLGADELARRSVPPSTMSLLGLVRHLAEVERNWFQRILGGRPDLPPHFTTDADPDLDFGGAVGDVEVVREAFATWDDEVALADAWLDTLADDDLGRVVEHPREGGVAVRDVLVHLIEEYARHAGHADLLREAIDGRTGQ
jgi:uncharacterized damage-inducible protein DinB